METTHFLIIVLSLATILGCTKQDNQASAEAQLENMSVTVRLVEASSFEAKLELKERLPNEITTDDRATAIEQNDSGKKVMFWYDPMVEGRRFSKYGQSPFMDMKLVPHYAKDANEGAKS
jgi:hypothetical protein